MGSDESHFNVSLGSDGQSYKTTSTETTRLIGDGEKGGKGVWRWGKREIIYLSLHWHHQNDFCIKTGSVQGHFNVSVGSDGQSYKTTSTDHKGVWRWGGGGRDYIPIATLSPPE